MNKSEEEQRIFVKEKIIKYIKNNRPKINISKIDISIEKLKMCLNNDNYRIIIIENETQKILDQYFLKIFRNKIDNKKLESDVQKILGEKNLSPKLLEMNDEEKYRIDEYIPDLCIIAMEDCLKENIIEYLIKIILNFNNLYHLCYYKIDKNYNITYIEDKSIINYNKDVISINFNINSFYQHLNEYLPKAKVVLTKFIESYNLNKNKINLDLDTKIENLKYYVDNYKSILVENIFKNEGYFVFSHSDFHRGNVIHKKNNFDKLYVVDNDFINLNLIGYDLIYYLIKSIFSKGIVKDYLNLTKFYKIYLQYISKFLNEFDGFKNDDKNLTNAKNYLKNIASSKDYFLRLIKLVLLFDIIYCCWLINFENEFLNDKPKFKFFDYLYMNIEVLKQIEECDISKI